MYTRCTECRTVFHITVAELRAADGRVVCGQCDTEFDALDNLTDTLPAADEAPQPAAEAPESQNKDEPSSDARDEDDFLREIESLIVEDGSDEGLPAPDEVFRIEEGQDREGRVVIAEALEGGSAEEARPGDAEDAPGPAPEPESGGAPEPETGAPTDAAEETEARQDGDDSTAAEPEPPPLPLSDTSPGRSRWPRAVAGMLALVVLGGAWAHLERGRLLRDPVGQAILAPVYTALGADASPDWSPEDLKVLRSATITDPDAPGRLRVTTEFRNAAGFAQPYPVLRVTLEDRWGQQVSTRDFTASEYLATPVAGRRMGAGERVQATVSLPDPGAAADGFRVDLCLDGPGRRLQCATDSAR